VTADDVQKAQKRLKRAEDAKRRRAMGKPLKLTDAALEEAAQVREADVESAVAFWRKNASPEFRDLLDAEVVE
jgi:hypothetical protein